MVTNKNVPEYMTVFRDGYLTIIRGTTRIESSETILHTAFPAIAASASARQANKRRQTGFPSAETI